MQASFAEKIYLQLDSKVYTTDKTIWFKSIVTNAIDHTPTTLSSVGASLRRSQVNYITKKYL
jgi:hypothetical protein